jgi:hypothetical protein
VFNQREEKEEAKMEKAESNGKTKKQNQTLTQSKRTHSPVQHH